MEQRNILEISTPLMDTPLYVDITSPTLAIGEILAEAIKSLEDTGRNHESAQISSLVKDHDIFSKGVMFKKGDLFSSLNPEKKEINGEIVNYASLCLMKSHVGGQ